MARIRRKVGMVFQSAALFDSLTVAENVGFAWRNEKLPRPELEKRVKETLEVVGISNVEERMPAEPGGGMKKRVGLSRCQILLCSQRPCYMMSRRLVWIQ